MRIMDQTREYILGRIDKKPTAEASNAVADKVGRKCDQNLVTEVTCITLVEILRKILSPDYVVSIWCSITDTSHDGDQHVLFCREFAWVQAMSRSEECKPPIWKQCCCCSSNWVTKQLHYVGLDIDRWLSDREELVNES
jgi:hypothetical protein